MKEVSITDFKKLQVKDIKEGGSFNLTENGSFLAIVVVPPSAEKRFQIQALCSQMNAAFGIKN